MSTHPSPSASQSRPGLARVLTGTLEGLQARRVRVEADVAPSLPGFSLVGLPSAAVRESRERVGAALRNAGYRWPEGRITVSLAPADLRKDGAAMDLALAVSLLLASGQLPRPDAGMLRRTLFVGELALDGALRPAVGAAALALDARRLGVDRIVAARSQVASFHDAEGVGIVALEHLRDLPRGLGLLRRGGTPPPTGGDAPADDGAAAAAALTRIRGQARAKRALLVAAAGGHHLVFEGPPGCGKTLLAKTLVDLLPPLDRQQARERRRIHSCAGLELGGGEAYRPPLRAPHHTVSTAGLVGGGRPLRPGEVTLAHRGVLLLDELPEFGLRRLERLREPLVGGRIELVRAGERLELPARFQLVATANPCPCGWWGSSLDRCRCPIHVVERYRRRLSGPLRDRIDLWVGLDREEAALCLGGEEVDDRRGSSGGDSVSQWREVVRRVRRHRNAVGGAVDGDDADRLLRWISADPGAADFVRQVADRRGLSVRALVSTLRIARTLAALDAGIHGNEKGQVRRAHLAEAFTYRPPETADGV